MAKRQKKSPRERFLYLRELVTEFQDTSSENAKEQVLANLANFAYDPDNFKHIAELNIVDLFLDQLSSENSTLIEFAIGGICNLALDKKFKQLIYKRGGIENIIKCLSSENEETVLSAMTTLMFLVSRETRADIVTPSVIDYMLRCKEGTNERLSSLAAVFLEDYCKRYEIHNAKWCAMSHSDN